jgi:hypothetical protein
MFLTALPGATYLGKLYFIMVISLKKLDVTPSDVDQWFCRVQMLGFGFNHSFIYKTRVVYITSGQQPVSRSEPVSSKGPDVIIRS